MALIEYSPLLTSNPNDNHNPFAAAFAASVPSTPTEATTTTTSPYPTTATTATTPLSPSSSSSSTPSTPDSAPKPLKSILRPSPPSPTSTHHSHHFTTLRSRCSSALADFSTHLHQPFHLHLRSRRSSIRAGKLPARREEQSDEERVDEAKADEEDGEVGFGLNFGLSFPSPLRRRRRVSWERLDRMERMRDLGDGVWGRGIGAQ